MFTVPWMIFKVFFASALKVVAGVFAWLWKHPIVLVGIVALVLGLFGGCQYKTAWAEKQVADIKAEVAKNQKKALEEAEKIAEESKVKADKLEKENNDLKLALQETTGSYEAALEEAKKTQKIKIIKVNVPGRAQPVDVSFEGDKQVCRAYPSTYKDTVNKLVKQTEEALGGP